MTTARQTRRTTKKDAWRVPFLTSLADLGNVKAAVEIAGVSRAFVYEERGRDAVFAQAWDAALETASDVMEREAFRRAVEGVDEPVFSPKGFKVGTVRKYSDTLLIFLLKGARPEKYRERQDIAHSGHIQVEYVNDWRTQD
jgi:hypothetical protein